MGERNALAAPDVRLGFVDLPNTRLHYAASGDGPPLIIVPATVSLIRQWQPLVQFLGLRYRAYFFELPGHGLSSPYPQRFSSHLVPPTVESLVERLGFARFNLMGFSFGGLLALRTLEHLQDRIDKVFLLSPLVSRKAILYSRWRQGGMKLAAQALKQPTFQRLAARLMREQRLHKPLISLLSRFSKIDPAILESKDALKIPATTLDVLSHTLIEILNTEYRPKRAFTVPCYFGMSVHDDLIEYNLTERFVKDHFQRVRIQKFYHPYHQPPHPPTFEWLVQEFYPFLDLLDTA